MKFKSFSTKIACGAFILAAATFASCSDSVVGGAEDITDGATDATTATGITTVKLASFPSSQERVTLVPQTKALTIPGSLELHATIANLSKEAGKIAGFEKEEGGRHLSATCVYFDPSSETYYVTYHMQGNNYNTTQTNETAGYIETFTLDENDAPIVGNIYAAANPSELSFDFNHLFFDDLSNTNNNGNYTGEDTGVRIIAVGHQSEVSNKEGGKPNTKAIIAKLNLDTDEPTIEKAVVYTGEKILNENGKSLGKVDAGDVNCVIRKYNYYYLATRKGIAVLNAKPENMFTPIPNYNIEPYQAIENSIYFVHTPGSAKHLANYYPAYGSGFSFLYLTEDTPEDFNGETKLPASLINFSMNAKDGTLCGMNSADSKTTGPSIFNTDGFDITNWSPDVNQFKVSDAVYPVDGKNVLANLDGRLYACLGKGGLYVRKNASDYTTIKFTDAKDGTGSRPVNGVFVEDVENFNDGFIYVANGACLTILDRETLEKVAEYSAFEEGDASANYIHVYKTDHYTGKCPDRLITVAYGQAGVKVFKFVPPSR